MNWPVAIVGKAASIGNQKRYSGQGFGVDRMAAGRARVVAISTASGLGGRKVRAPQDTVVGNAHRPRGQGKCNRKQTAARALGSRAVRVKR